MDTTRYPELLNTFRKGTVKCKISMERSNNKKYYKMNRLTQNINNHDKIKFYIQYHDAKPGFSIFSSIINILWQSMVRT